MFAKSLNEIFSGWKNSWIKFLLNFTSIGTFFKAQQNKEISTYEFLKVYFTSHGLSRWFFLGFIKNEHNKQFFKDLTIEQSWFNLIFEENNKYVIDTRSILPSYNNFQVFTQNLRILKYYKLLNKKNFDLLAKHANPRQLLLGFCEISTYSDLSQENFNYLIAYPNPNLVKNLAKALNILQLNGLATSTNFDFIADSKHPEMTARAFCIINRFKILNSDTRTYLKLTDTPIELANIMCRLQHLSILNLKILELVTKSINCDDLIDGLIALKENGILSPENWTCLTKNQQPQKMAQAFCLLYQSRLLNDNNRMILGKYIHFFPILKGLEKLKKADILNQNNFDLIVQKQHPENIFNCDLLIALGKLDSLGILNDENFKFLARGQNPNELYDILHTFHHHQILNSNHLRFISTLENPKAIIHAMLAVHSAGILNDLNRQRLINPSVSSDMSLLLQIFANKNSLNQESFNSLMALSHQSLFTHEARDILLKLDNTYLNENWKLVLQPNSIDKLQQSILSHSVFNQAPVDKNNPFLQTQFMNF